LKISQIIDLQGLTGGVPSFVSPYLRLDNAVQRRPFSGELRIPGFPCLTFPISIALSGVFSFAPHERDYPSYGGGNGSREETGEEGAEKGSEEGREEVSSIRSIAFQRSFGTMRGIILDVTPQQSGNDSYRMGDAGVAPVPRIKEKHGRCGGSAWRTH